MVRLVESAYMVSMIVRPEQMVALRVLLLHPYAASTNPIGF